MDNSLETPAANPVTAAEQMVQDERDTIAPTAPRILTDEEWIAVKPPFYYIEVDYDRWTNLEYEIATKFVVKNGTGWVYYRDKRFIFEKEDDFVLFRMWAENKPLQEANKMFEIK